MAAAHGQLALVGDQRLAEGEPARVAKRSPPSCLHMGLEEAVAVVKGSLGASCSHAKAAVTFHA